MSQWDKVGNIMGPQGPAGAPGTGGMNGVFNEIPSQVLPPPSHAWASRAPATTAVSNGYVLGARFQCNVAGQIVALRFYSAAASTVTSRVMKLWKEPAHTLVATSQASTETTAQSGWVELPLATPVNVAVGDQYVVSYEEPSGDTYGQTVAKTTTTDSPNLSVVTSAVYSQTLGVFPGVNSPNVTYFVDLSLQLPTTVFQTANAYQPNTLMVYLNGLRQRKPDDYSETTSTTFTMAVPPLSADTLLIDYML